MKIKIDFVTNSSSSSFIIQKHDVTPLQIFLIKNHYEILNRVGEHEYDISKLDEWEIDESDDTIRGYTSMDNFDMSHYLSEIGIPSHRIEWD